MLSGGWTETPSRVHGGRGSRARDRQTVCLSVMTTPSLRQRISISLPVLAGAYCEVKVERWFFCLLVGVRDTLLDGNCKSNGM
jgi:hypothetical protein